MSMKGMRKILSSVQSLSPVHLFVTPWTSGFTVHHQLWELTQIHVHRFGVANKPSHALSSPSPPAFNLSPNQFFPLSQFFISGGQSFGASASASILLMNIQD